MNFIKKYFLLRQLNKSLIEVQNMINKASENIWLRILDKSINIESVTKIISFWGELENNIKNKINQIR